MKLIRYVLYFVVFAVVFFLVMQFLGTRVLERSNTVSVVSLSLVAASISTALLIFTGKGKSQDTVRMLGGR